MKGTGKLLFGISVLSLMMLLYVHEQVMVFRISYRLHEKSSQLTRKSDEYRKLKFEVDQLKAPRLLEERLKGQTLELSLPEEVRVVKIPKIMQREHSEALPDFSANTLSGRFASFLGRWIDVAQAKTDN